MTKPKESQGWEERFDRRFPSAPNRNVGHYIFASEPDVYIIKDFIRSELAKAREEAISDTKKQWEIQGQKRNWDASPYMTGLFNGLEMAVANFEKREPKFRECKLNTTSYEEIVKEEREKVIEELYEPLVHEFQNSEHRIDVGDDGTHIIISTNYRSLVRKALDSLSTSPAEIKFGKDYYYGDKKGLAKLVKKARPPKKEDK